MIQEWDQKLCFGAWWSKASILASILAHYCKWIVIDWLGSYRGILLQVHGWDTATTAKTNMVMECDTNLKNPFPIRKCLAATEMASKWTLWGLYPFDISCQWRIPCWAGILHPTADKALIESEHYARRSIRKNAKNPVCHFWHCAQPQWLGLAIWDYHWGELLDP